MRVVCDRFERVVRKGANAGNEKTKTQVKLDDHQMMIFVFEMVRNIVV